MVLIARENELDAVVERLRRHRLVTIVGPGGVGKTALARVAADLAGSHFALGALTVDLTRVDDPELVAELMAGQLGFADFPSLVGSPSDRSALLLIDNCEHVLDAAADAVDSILACCRMPTVLATSRSPLDVADEAIVSLAPLPVPPADFDDDTVGAVRMFIERAGDLGMPPGPDDLPVVAEICRRLDGVPLALEIAAARTRTSTLRQLLDEIGTRPSGLSRPRFRGQSAHRSVRDMVDWSLALLDDDVRSAFDQLGAVSGPFDRPMAEAVVAGIDRPVEELLDELAAASLVVVDPTGSEVTYRLLHPVRAVAAERLRQSGGDADATDRAVGHMVEVAISVMHDASAAWNDQIRILLARYDNIIASLRWAVEHDDRSSRSMILLSVLWGTVFQAHRAEVAELGERVLKRWPDPTERFWAEAANTVATCRNLLGGQDEAVELATTALHHGRPSPFTSAALRRLLAQADRIRGRTAAALDGFAAAAEAATAEGVHSLAMAMRVDHAVLVDELGDSRRAEQLLHSTLAEAERRAASINISWARCGLAAVHQRHRHADVLDELQDVIDHARAIEYPAALVLALRLVATEHLERGELAAAATALLDLQAALLVRGGLGDMRLMLEPAAELLLRVGDDRWADVAVTARALPITLTLTAPSTGELLERAEGTGEVLAIRDVYELCRVRIGELAHAAPPEEQTAVPATDATTPPVPDPVSSTLVLEGDVWRWSYAGDSIAVKASKGMSDLARLIAEPHREISAMDLMGSTKVADSGTETLDARARREIEERIRELQGDIEEAEDHHDFVRAERASAELDQLVEQLSAAVGLGGKARATGGDTERARSAVTQRIRSTISRIDKLHPQLGGHLATSIETGTFCAYGPADDIEWTIQR